MRYGWWSEATIREGNLPLFLREVEQTWGVHVHVYCCQIGPPNEQNAMLLGIEIPFEIHRGELCDPPTMLVPMIDRRLMPLEAQFCALVAQWVDMVTEHMRVKSAHP